METELFWSGRTLMYTVQRGQKRNNRISRLIKFRKENVEIAKRLVMKVIAEGMENYSRQQSTHQLDKRRKTYAAKSFAR